MKNMKVEDKQDTCFFWEKGFPNWFTADNKLPHSGRRLLLGFYSSGNTVAICHRGGLTAKRDVNPAGMEILLNKLKAGCFLEHWAESGATHSLPSCIMHTNMLFLCSARWIIAPSYCSSGFGLRWRDEWGKADSLSGLRCTPSHQADTVELSGKRLTEGIWTGSEAHLGSASLDLAAGKHVKTYSSFINSRSLLNL